MLKIILVVIGAIFLSATPVAAQVDLTFAPSQTTLNRQDAFTVDVLIDAKNFLVSAASVSAHFSADHLQLNSLTAGPFFTADIPTGFTAPWEYIDTTVPGVGTIIVGAACPTTTEANPPTTPCTVRSGNGILATYSFQVKDSAPTGLTQIDFAPDPGTAVAAVGNATSVLSSVAPAVLTITPTTSASLALTGIPSQVVNGSNLTVGVDLTTNAPISGVDAIITFSADKLQATSVTDHPLLPTTPRIEINNTTGLIRVSQVADPDSSWQGSGQMFSLNFTTISTGQANLGFAYTPGATDDSNVIAKATGTDILTLPVNATTIVTDPPTPSSTPTPTPTPTPLPPIAGDINADGIVNNLDLSLMYDDWFGSVARSDLNSDGIVNSADYWLLTQNFFLQ